MTSSLRTANGAGAKDASTSVRRSTAPQSAREWDELLLHARENLRSPQARRGEVGASLDERASFRAARQHVGGRLHRNGEPTYPSARALSPFGGAHVPPI